MEKPHTAARNARSPIEGHQSSDTVSTEPAPHSVGATPHRKLKTDIAVIGAGSGGLSVAAGAAMLGLDVVLFEKGEMGGDCLNYGCVPSKALLTAARKAQVFREAATWGLTPADPGVDWQAVKAHVKTAITNIAPVDSVERFEGMGVTVIREHARFSDEKTLHSASASVEARRIVIATGSTALVPPIPGLDETAYHTNETLFDIEVLPAHLVILGGGPIGIEMAQAFRRLGSDVTVIEKETALGKADPEHANVALSRLRDEGVRVLEGHEAVRASNTDNGIMVVAKSDGTEETIHGSHLLVALGRKAVLDGLALDAGNVERTKTGIATKDNLKSVSNSRVWAVGDAAGREQFTHMAGWHASVFVQAALMKLRTKADKLPVPAVTYIEPELAQVGLTEAEAREKHGDDVTVAAFSFMENDRAQAERDITGGCKIFVGKGDEILGASIVGEGAGDIIQIIGYGMSNGQKMRSLTNFISPYPTRAEIVKRTASDYFRPKVFGKLMKTAVGVLQRIP